MRRMFLHGIWRSVQDDGDFRVGLAFGDPVKHLRFACRQSQGQERLWALLDKSMFNPYERQASRWRQREFVDFDFTFSRMTCDKRPARITFDQPGANLIRDKVIRLFCKEGLQDYSCLSGRKQNFSAGIRNQERLIERVLQEFTHSMLKGESD